MDDSEENAAPTVPLFGKKVTDIPCFRDSFLYGLLGGFGSGVAFFLFTSRVKRAADIAVGTFVTVTGCYWMNCRYKWSKDRFMYQQLKAGLRDYLAKEGVEDTTEPEKAESV